MYKKIEKCRICGSAHLERVLDLGEQMLTGVFPRQRNEMVTTGPLQLVKCMGEGSCGLLQLEHSYSLDEMYGDNYGYRSGLNPSMVAHLQRKVKRITESVNLRDADLVVDIGSNDSTTLQAYPSTLTLVGIDPTGIKFHSFYPPHIHLIPDFFSPDLLKDRFPNKKARVITSFSMFYDLEDPLRFMRSIFDVLADDGVWVFEQSYMPTMLERNSYDTVCHEHLEYYSLTQIKWMTDRVGFTIVDVEFNEINGGSFSITVKKQGRGVLETVTVPEILKKELDQGLNTLEPYEAFAERAAQSRRSLREFVRNVQTDGKVIAALGASTKGNVILQYCGMTSGDISYVGEVNGEKFDCFTPGSWIPIIPESDLIELKPDYFLILPWHFQEFFLKHEKFKTLNLVFPLPTLHVHQRQ